MKATTAIIILIIIVLLGGGLYYWYTQNNNEYGSPSGAAGINGSPNQGNLGQPDNGTPQQPAGPATLNTTTSSAINGPFLAAANGMTLYTYSKDTAGVSNCTGQCAANWPPYTVSSPADLNLAAGLTGTLGTITRADGSLQVTYKGKPVYFYVKDKSPGDTVGQGVGGVWYVVTP